jgi:hypothetical protein
METDRIVLGTCRMTLPTQLFFFFLLDERKATHMLLPHDIIYISKGGKAISEVSLSWAWHRRLREILSWMKKFLDAFLLSML